MTPPPYDIPAAVERLGLLIHDPSPLPLVRASILIGQRLARTLLDNHCTDPADAVQWGHALIVAAASIGGLITTITGPALNGPSFHVADASLLAANVQAFAGWYLATGTDPGPAAAAPPGGPSHKNRRTR